MSDDNETFEFDDSRGETARDPLGIIGWNIGGKYKIRTYIGGGGFGEVYEGYNKNLPEQKLVFKFFKKVQSRDKFAKEAKILCLLNHPNICRVVDFLPDEGAVVVAYIDGQDGGQKLKQSGPLPEKLFLNVARAITGAMAYAHSKNIAHRDIKPSNIMFDNNDHVYMIDFGIAKEMSGDATKTAYQTMTPLFAAPERQAGEVDYNPFLSDIYEIGIALFNFATNSLPYRNPANPDPAEWGGSAANKLSPSLRRILVKATHPEPSKRFQNAEELAAQFEKLDHAYGDKTSGKRRLTTLLIGAVIAAAVIVAAVTQLPRLIGPPSDTTSPMTVTDPEPDVIADSTPAADSPAVIPETESDMLTEKPPPTSPPADEKEPPAEKEPEPEPEPETPPPPSEQPFRIDLLPDGQAAVALNGSEGPADTTFMLLPGRHRLRIIHQDFPILEKELEITPGHSTTGIDLATETASPDSVNLQISLSPPSDQLMVDFGLNGRHHTLTEFPVFDLTRLKGPWRLEAEIMTLDPSLGTPRIDSLVTFPYGGGNRAAIHGASGIIPLGERGGPAMETVPVLIYWSKQ